MTDANRHRCRFEKGKAKMRTRSIMATAFAIALTLHGEDGTFIANGSFAGTFSVYTSDKATYAVESAAAFATLPLVFYRRGETATATARNGASKTLVSSASGTGTVSLGSETLDLGGVWTLSNSGQGQAQIGVAWSVYGDGGMLMTGDFASAYVVDTVQTGPSRKLMDRNAPPIAYSGDDWAGDVSRAATVTFTPPNGSGLEPTTWEDLPGGNGVRSFTFSKTGRWKVLMTFANGTMREATVNVVGGFVMTFY